jgi:hypothetical protein
MKTMDRACTVLDASLADFRKHHQNPYNIAFHVICGLVYTSLLFSIVGGLMAWALLALYVGTLVILFPTCFLVTTAMGGMLGTLLVAEGLLGLPALLKIMLAGIFYMAPELSHMWTGERTVLRRDTLTLALALENVLLLLPYSMYVVSGCPTFCTASKEPRRQMQTRQAIQ